MSFSSPAKQKISAALGQYAANELEALISAAGGAVVHLENEEIINGYKMFSVSAGINGIRYEWPRENRSGVLLNDGSGNLSWSHLAGVGTVTSIGLLGPEEFIVGDPVHTCGNLTFGKAPQAPSVVYAGPPSGVPGLPTFRRLVAQDLPALPIDKVIKLSELLNHKVDADLYTKRLEEIRAALDGKLEGVTFAQALTEVDRKIEDLRRIKADSETLAQAHGQLSKTLARKIDRDTMEESWAEMRERLDLLHSLMDSKVSIAAPRFGAPATVADLTLADGALITVGSNHGTRIGSGKAQKLAFFNAIPVPQPAGDVLTALANLGLVSQPTIWMSEIVGLVDRLEKLEERSILQEEVVGLVERLEEIEEKVRKRGAERKTSPG